MTTLKNVVSAAGKIAVAIAALAIFCTVQVLAQAASVTVHGKVTDPTGTPMSKGDIKFSKDVSSDEKNMKFIYTFPIGPDGTYTATGVAPGDYIVFVFQGDIHADYQKVTLKAGEDKTLDFDMTREEYMKSLTPERRKEIEDFKKKNAEVTSANKVINNLNATLAKARADLAAALPTKGDVSSDVTDMQAATAAKPDESILWFVYGDTLQAQGDHLAAADKAAGKLSTTDDAVLKLYSDAADAYKKSADLNAASKKPDVNTQSSAYNQIGLTLAKEGKLKEASEALDTASKLEPANAGMYYGNEAAILFNSNQAEASLVAADKAIAADPTRADPYFIKGQALVGQSTLDPKTQKLIAPPGCIEAYEKYLELAPDGKQAATVKDILQAYDVKIDTSYRAGKKH